MAHEHHPEQPPPGATGDYGYDMAHDFEPADIPASAAAHQEHPPVYVATESSDTDEDYSYDLAHDVPPQSR
jgi:hypothetical protein